MHRVHNKIYVQLGGLGFKVPGEVTWDLVMSLQASSAHWRAARKLRSCIGYLIIAVVELVWA